MRHWRPATCIACNTHISSAVCHPMTVSCASHCGPVCSLNCVQWHGLHAMRGELTARYTLSQRSTTALRFSAWRKHTLCFSLAIHNGSKLLTRTDRSGNITNWLLCGVTLLIDLYTQTCLDGVNSKHCLKSLITSALEGRQSALQRASQVSDQ